MGRSDAGAVSVFGGGGFWFLGTGDGLWNVNVNMNVNACEAACVHCGFVCPRQVDVSNLTKPLKSSVYLELL